MINKLFKFVERNTDKIVFFAALLLSIASFIYYYNQGLITAFGDSKGHLNIARRVVDTVTPGFAQLGAYWLPLLHILMLPTIWIDSMWHSGLAGAIPNIIAYSVSAVYIYRIVKLFTNSKTSALLAGFSLLLNPNFLYMSTTPMTEVLFTLTVLGVVYHFYRWTIIKSTSHLILAGVWAFLSSVTRYEGWAIVAIATFLIIIQWVRSRLSPKWEGKIILFSIVAWLGIILWILWGAILVNDPLDFMRNEMSARNQTKATYDLIKATGDHYLPGAILTNALAFKHVVGIIATIVVLIVGTYYTIRYRAKLFDIRYNFLLLFTAPLLFDILSVFLGNVPVEVPELSMVPPPGNYFNIRYALFSLPLLCFLAFVVTKKKIINYLIFCLIIVSYITLLLPGTKLVALNDAGSVSLGSDYTRSVKWFKENYDDGLVLASTGGSDGFMFDVGINLSNYIVEGSYIYWDNSLKEPEKYATWVIMDSGNIRDAVNKYVDKDKINQYYSLVYRANTYTIYKRNYPIL